MRDLTKLTAVNETALRLERLEKCEADLIAARNRIDDDTETINRMCAKLGRLEKCEEALRLAQSAMDSAWAAIWDKHYGGGRLSVEYTQGISSEIQKAKNAARAALEGK